MSWILDFYRSAMGKKAVMAVTGIVLLGFVFGHMIGNLKLYMGPGHLDEYAVGLRELGKPFLAKEQGLWLFRLGLLAAVALHIHAAVTLNLHNRRQARPVKYARNAPQASTYASRTMIWGGLIVAAFIVYHLLHLTVGSVHPDFEHGAVYANVVIGFQNPWVSGFYIVANLALGFHLYHGMWSLFQTLGWNGPRLNVFRQRLAAAFAVVVCAANISFPVAVLSGLVTLGG